MAEISLTPRRATFAVEVDADIEIEKHPSLDEAVMVPYNVAHYLLDEFRMKNGWPVPVPTHDIRAEAMTSATGAKMAKRPHPAQLTSGAAVRWIAGSTWDATSLRWHPSAGFPEWTWESSAEYAPTLVSDYAYRVHGETVLRDALNFQDDASEHLWSNFAAPISSAQSFSVILVLSLVARYSVDINDPSYTSVIAPGHPTPAGGPATFAEEVTGSTFAVQLRGPALHVNADQTLFRRVFDIAPLLERTAPSYLGITVVGPDLMVFMGPGPSQLQYARLDDNEAYNHLNWVLGRATGSLAHCADMSLFEVGFYVEPLNKNEMITEIARLAASYGGQ